MYFKKDQELEVYFINKREEEVYFKKEGSKFSYKNIRYLLLINKEVYFKRIQYHTARSEEIC